MAIYSMGVMHPMLVFVKVEILPLVGFWAVILVPGMVE